MYVRRYGELPLDLREQDELTMGPPPAWYTVALNAGNNGYPGYPGYPGYMPYPIYTMAGLGDRETEVEVNPVEHLLKIQQEMPKNIPLVANRYTNIDPLSPMFRSDIPKYGFGSWEALANKRNVMILAAVLLAALYFKNK